MAVVGASMTSCKNEEQKMSEKTVDMQTTYVDSVASISAEDASANWAAIDAAYQQRTMDAEAALANASDKEKAQEKIDKSKAKYEELKAKVEAAMPPAPTMDTTAVAGTTPDASGDTKSQALRDGLFGPGKLNRDLNFAWVTKDNILGVYERLAVSFDQNRKNYDNADTDAVKAMYRALNDRKDILDKEGKGLDTKDNLKIAAIKTKLAPVLTLDQATKK